MTILEPKVVLMVAAGNPVTLRVSGREVGRVLAENIFLGLFRCVMTGDGSYPIRPDSLCELRRVRFRHQAARHGSEIRIAKPIRPVRER
jgi:hypothetical protein